MKILFFSHQAEFLYGGEIVTLEFARELGARGHEVHFASPAGPYQERVKAAGVRTHTVSSRQFSRRLAQLPAIAASLVRVRSELRAIAAREGVEILHATSLKAMAFAWSAGLPTLWHHHDILPPGAANDLWVRVLAARAARILVPSAATREALVRAGVAGEKVRVLRNGFRVEEWKRRPLREGSQFRIGVVGEISRRKGTDRVEGLLSAFREDPSVRIEVIGEGLSEPEFAAGLRRRLGSDRIQFLGRRADVKALYQEMDLLFVPSRQDPLPTVIVEAGLSGVPIVGSAAGGIPEMVENGSNGFTYDMDRESPERGAELIHRVRADWNRFSASSRAIAEARYDVRKLTGELERHYAEVRGGA